MTEGKVTEPEYIRQFQAWCRNSRVEIFIEEGAGDPSAIVSKAKELATKANSQADGEGDENHRFEEVWCVFDIDDHTRFAESKQRAIDLKFRAAISNPCIEIWLYLHFAGSPGIQPRAKLTKLLKKYVKAYDKHVDFELSKQGYELAKRRAQNLEEDAITDKEEGRNPSTGFWKLTESIRKNS